MTGKATLAIHGGSPIRSAPMPPRLALGEGEFAMIREVYDYYRSRQVDPGYQGPFEERYCAAFVETMGGGYADAVATGTAAVFVAVAALGLPEGSEVVVSPITDPGTLSAIILNRLVPRLADARPGSYSMGAEEFAARVTSRTRAVVVVHTAGQPADVDTIVAEAHSRGIKVVEDCSQAHGATLRGRPVGTFGDIAAFSTMYRKAHITGASGGLVYSGDRDLLRMALAHADRGKPRWSADFDDRDPGNYLFPALNLHTDEISCAVGIASLARLPETIRKRLEYIAGLDRLRRESNVCRPYGWTEGDSPFYYPVLVETEALSCDKTSFAKAVLAEGIGLNPHYKYLVRDWPWVAKHLADDFACPNARRIRDKSFCLYVNENYGPQEIDDTVAAIIKVEKAFV